MLKIDFCQELSLGGAIYGSDCMVVCNDWHSALVPMLIHAEKTTTGALGCWM
jgi:glycogen synthase